MKFKSKLIGILSTSVLATASIATIASCAKETEAPKYDNRIIFTGERNLSPVAGSRSIVIEGFSLLNELGGDNFDALTVSSSNSEVEVEIVEGSRPTTKNFSISAKAQIFDSALNQNIDFNLIFTFYKNSHAIKKMSISSFVFNYHSVWDERKLSIVVDQELWHQTMVLVQL